MYFRDLLKRANVSSLEFFLLHGVEGHERPPEQTYSERLDAAEEKITSFLRPLCKKRREFDEITGYLCNQMDVYQDVYFEIGLIAGAKLAFQLRGGMEELL